MPINHKEVRLAFEKRAADITEKNKKSSVQKNMLDPIIQTMRTEMNRTARTATTDTHIFLTPTISHRSNSFFDTWRDIYFMELMFGRREQNVYVTTINNTNVTNNITNVNSNNRSGSFFSSTLRSSSGRQTNTDEEKNGSALLALLAVATMIVVASVDYVIIKYLSSKIAKKMADPFRKTADILKAAVFGLTAYLGYIGGSSAAVFYLGAFASPAVVGVAGGLLAGILAGGIFYGFTKQVFRLTNKLVYGHTNSAAHLPKAAMLNAAEFQNMDSKKLGKTLAEVSCVLKEMHYSEKEVNAVIRNPLYAPMIADIEKQITESTPNGTPPTYDWLYDDILPAYTPSTEQRTVRGSTDEELPEPSAPPLEQIKPLQ